MKAENIKILEIRDRQTFIPVFAIRMLPSCEEEIFLFNEIGYRSKSDPCILLISMQAPWCSARSSDEWRDDAGRSLRLAHQWIEKNFDEIQPYQVIDVEFINREVKEPCKSVFRERVSELAQTLIRINSDQEKIKVNDE